MNPDTSNEPLVSAIIIFFNGEKYLAEAIDSVVAQTYANWELILCDDGSTDGSRSIAERYAALHPGKIRCVAHEGNVNRGMSATRNLGLRHARGTYVSWLDADDVWLPHKLHRQLELLREHPQAAMVYGPLQYWYSWSGRPADAGRDFVNPPKMARDLLHEPPVLCLSFLQDESTIPGGVMVRRDVLESVGGYDDTFRDEYEDVIVHAKVCLRWPVFASSESLYRYRQHEESCGAETRRVGRRSARRERFLQRLSDYLSQKGLTESPVGIVVRDQLATCRTYRYRLRQRMANLRPRAKRLLKMLLPGGLYVRLRTRWYTRRAAAANRSHKPAAKLGTG